MQTANLTVTLKETPRALRPKNQKTSEPQRRSRQSNEVYSHRPSPLYGFKSRRALKDFIKEAKTSKAHTVKNWPYNSPFPGTKGEYESLHPYVKSLHDHLAYLAKQHGSSVPDFVASIFLQGGMR